MFDQLSAEILASLIKGFPRTTTTTTTKQNVDPAVHFVYSRVKITKFQGLQICATLISYYVYLHYMGTGSHVPICKRQITADAHGRR
jgi:hypothetical protein